MQSNWISVKEKGMTIPTKPISANIQQISNGCVTPRRHLELNSSFGSRPSQQLFRTTRIGHRYIHRLANASHYMDLVRIQIASTTSPEEEMCVASEMEVDRRRPFSS